MRPEQMGISEGTVYALHRDRQGTIWLGDGWNIFRSADGGKRLYEWKGLKEKDNHHRIAEGKYLKYLYSLHEKRGTLDVTNVRELCPHCNMRSCCERDGSVEKLSVYCIEGCFHK